MHKLLTPPVAALAILALASNVFAQQPNPRYELGWRLQQLERAWETARDVESRKRALPQVEGAVQSFFQLRLTDAAEQLDLARQALAAATEGCNAQHAWALTPSCRLVDAGLESLPLDARPFYEPCDSSAYVFTAGFDGDTEHRAEGQGETMSSSSGVPPLRLAGAPLGDRRLSVCFFNGDWVRSERTMTLSIVERRDERLSALEAAIEKLPETAPPLERETSTAVLALLNSLAKGSTEECDYPGARLLAECEQVVAAAAKGERFYGSTRTGQFWLAVPTGSKRPARVRVFVPATKPDAPPPLVVALHGAGGSENMFFETYGDGEIVRQCERRGWMLVAPRVGFGLDVPALVDALAERYAFDRSRVFLVGHSMGAAAAISAATATPERYRALVALGGGRAPKRPELLKAMPVFIGAGERDFGRPGAKELHDALMAVGSDSAELRIYPNTEHLLVVQDALPDVFALFERSAGVEGDRIEPLAPQPRDR